MMSAITPGAVTSNTGGKLQQHPPARQKNNRNHILNILAGRSATVPMQAAGRTNTSFNTSSAMAMNQMAPAGASNHRNMVNHTQMTAKPHPGANQTSKTAKQFILRHRQVQQQQANLNQHQ